MLELGNKILEVLGAEEKITEVEHFYKDSIYLQIFHVLFPQYNFQNIELGKTKDDQAWKIGQLIMYLEKYVLETDISDVKAKNIVNGDLDHVDEFLQVLLQVIYALYDVDEKDDSDSD